MTFLLARFWPYIAGVVAVLALLAGVYQTGYNVAWRKAGAANLRSQVEVLTRDRDNAAKAVMRATADNAELERLRDGDQEKINALLAIAHDGAGRGLTQRELDGLLNIR